LPVWLYLLDEFTPLDIDSSELLELSESPYKLFELVRGAVEERVGRVERVELYKTYIDPATLELLIEYIVEFEHGELSIKIIRSDNPVKTLQRYYEAEGGELNR